MKVSVVIAIYNVEKWLSDCLNTLKMQTMTDCEFLCVDDGSTDESSDIIQSFVEEDSRFIHVRHENIGLASSRNVGLEKAKGKYVVFLDGDDAWKDKHQLEILYNTAEAYDVDFVTFDSCAEYENEYVKKEKNVGDYLVRSKEYGFVSTGRELFFKMYENNDFCVMTWLLFMKKDWLIENNLGFKEGMDPEDNLFTFQCFMNARHGVYHIQRIFHIYKIRAGSLSVNRPRFQNVYSFLFTLKYELAYSISNDFSFREQELLLKHLDPLMGMVRDKFERIESIERAKVYGLPGIDYYLFKMINCPSFMPSVDIGIHVNGYFGILEKEPEFYIYGAGMVGKNLYRYLMMYKLLDRIKAFIVSRKSVKEKYKGIPIVSIEEVYEGKNKLVVVAVTEQYRREIVSSLYEHGFTKVIVTDDLMINYMSYCTG